MFVVGQEPKRVGDPAPRNALMGTYVASSNKSFCRARYTGDASRSDVDKRLVAALSRHAERECRLDVECGYLT